MPRIDVIMHIVYHRAIEIKQEGLYVLHFVKIMEPALPLSIWFQCFVYQKYLRNPRNFLLDKNPGFL